MSETTAYLRELALKPKALELGSDVFNSRDDDDAFRRAATPTAIISLLDRLARYEELEKAARAAVDAHVDCDPVHCRQRSHYAALITALDALAESN